MMSDYTPQEQGLPSEKAKPVDRDGQPRGNAMFPVPHLATFSGQVNTGSRVYYGAFDEASRNNREHARIIRLDPVIDACMRLRTYPTALLPFHAEPDDDQDATQVAAAANTEKLFASLPGFLYTKRWLLDQGIFVGRAGSKMRWQWVNKRGKNWHLPTAFEPVGGDKLVYGWDGSVGVRVNGMFSGPTKTDGWSRIYTLTVEEREQMIVHAVEPEDADFYRPMQAGAVHGVGLRDKLYWMWALKARVWALGIDFLVWFAQGLTAFYFEHGNDSHFKAVKEWVENQAGQSALLFPRMKDGGPGYKPIERFDASTASPQFIQQLVTEYFDELIRQVILGQTLMSQAGGTGLGSGVASAHQTTADIRIKYDAVGLQETLTRDLMVPFYGANYPGMPPARWVLDVDNPNVQQMLDGAETLYQMGGRVPEGTLLEAIGLPEVKPGDTILTNVQPMQPAAMDATPEGVPVVQGQPVKMTRRQYARLVQLSRTDVKIRRWALQHRRRIEIAAPLWTTTRSLG